MLAAGGGWCAPSEEVLGDGDGRADVGSKGGGAVIGDARGEASDKDEELPETASTFLFRGEGVSLGAWLGEASAMLVFIVSNAVRLEFSWLPFFAISICTFICPFGSRISPIVLSVPVGKLWNEAFQGTRKYGRSRLKEPCGLQREVCIQRMKV